MNTRQQRTGSAHVIGGSRALRGQPTRLAVETIGGVLRQPHAGSISGARGIGYGHDARRPCYRSDIENQLVSCIPSVGQTLLPCSTKEPTSDGSDTETDASTPVERKRPINRFILCTRKQQIPWWLVRDVGLIVGGFLLGSAAMKFYS